MIINTSGVERKAIGVGKDSLALTLPRKWILDQKIEKGSKFLLFPHKKGLFIIQKLNNPHTKVTLDLGTYECELLDTAILGSYLLNIDEITINFPDPGDTCASMNHFADLSQKFIGMSLASSGLTQVTIRNLSDVSKLRIPDIFNQMVDILLIFFDQIEHRDFTGNNTNQLLQMESQYRMGARLLLFILRNQYFRFETGRSSIIQVLGYRIALQALRLIILLVHNLFPFLKGVDLPDLRLCFKSLRDITQNAVSSLHASDLSSIRLLNESKHVLEEQASKIEDTTSILSNFFATYFILLTTLIEVAMTRCIEDLEVLSEEKDIF